MGEWKQAETVDHVDVSALLAMLSRCNGEE